jgi:hypothetical protein
MYKKVISYMRSKAVRIVWMAFFVLIPSVTFAAWTDNLIFYAPLNDISNPLNVSTGTGSFTFTRTSVATYIHPTTGLVTMSGENISMYSEDFSNTWATTSSNIVVDQVVAPDGTTTADEFVVGPATDGSTTHFVQISATSTGTIQASQFYTASVYVKANTNTWVAVAFVGKNGTANTCYFNASTGAVGTCSSNTTSSTTPSVNGFYRFAVSASSGSGAATVRERIYLASADNTQTFTGNGTNSLYIWGAQLNSGPIMAPYVRTTNDLAASPRIESLGYLAEGTRTNNLLWSRDMTNSAWTKTNVTAALTATGHDGSINSASLITATADAGTVCQGVTIATATSTGSVDIKRVSGTGTVSLSMDGGSTYGSDVSSSLSTSSWYRALFENQKIVNPSLCIKLGTNGDSVILDYAQIETSGTATAQTGAVFVSSRIPTTSTVNTRFIDKLSITSTNNWPQTEGSFFAIVDTWDTVTSNKFVIDGLDGSSRVPMHIRSGQGNGSNGTLGRTTLYDGSSECSYSSVNVQPQTTTKVASKWSATSSTRATTATGGTPTSCAFDGTLEVAGTMVLGDAHLQDGTRTLWGHIKQLRFWDTALSDATLILATSGGISDVGSAPGVVTSLATSSMATSTVTLSWTAPTSDGGYTLSDYTIQYKRSSDSSYTTYSDGVSTNTTVDLTGLTPNVGYMFAVSAVNSFGTGSSTVGYGTTTAISLPTTSTSEATSVTDTSATLGGSVSSVGGEDLTARGFVYGTSVSYGATTTTSGSFSTGSFSSSLSSLTCGTTYHFNAFATNSAGTSYGSDTTLSTSACASSSNSNSDSSDEVPAGTKNNGGVFVGDVSSLGVYIKPRLKTVYPDGRVVYLDENPKLDAKPAVNQNNSSNTSSSVIGFSGRVLKLGSTDSEVKKLQQFLNSQGYIIAKNGPGSPGNETEHFGALTKKALIRFQETYPRDILTPSGLSKGSGILGEKTLQKIKQLMK